MKILILFAALSCSWTAKVTEKKIEVAAPYSVQKGKLVSQLMSNPMAWHKWMENIQNNNDVCLPDEYQELLYWAVANDMLWNGTMRSDLRIRKEIACMEALNGK